MNAPVMTTPFSIDPHTGSICVGEGIRLEPHQRKASIRPQVVDWLVASQDHGNGYEWLHLDGLSFGGQPAALALCFNHGRLDQVSWSVLLPGAAVQEGWPTREAIDAEIAFVRETLGASGLMAPAKPSTFAWGEVWSDFDPKGDLASNGLRYR